jgi:hypothetical protein
VAGCVVSVGAVRVKRKDAGETPAVHGWGVIGFLVRRKIFGRFGSVANELKPLLCGEKGNVSRFGILASSFPVPFSFPNLT